MPECETEYAARVLANAFRDDPLYQHLLADGRERTKLLTAFFERFLTLVHGCADVWCTGSPVKGVAIGVSPEKQDECAHHLEYARLHDLPAIMGTEVAARLTGFLAWLDGLHKGHIRKPHWYLMLLGVGPIHQNQGEGTALVQHILKRADKEDVPSYVETQEAANVAFYMRFGFSVVGDRGIEPTTGLEAWTLIRNAKNKIVRTNAPQR